jgi:hypothetical protein
MGFAHAPEAVRAPARQVNGVAARLAAMALALGLCGGGALTTDPPLPLAMMLAGGLGLSTGVLIGTALMRMRPEWARRWLWANAAGWGPAAAVALTVLPPALELSEVAALGISGGGVGLLGGTVLALAAGGLTRASEEEAA